MKGKYEKQELFSEKDWSLPDVRHLKMLSDIICKPIFIIFELIYNIFLVTESEKKFKAFFFMMWINFWSLSNIEFPKKIQNPPHFAPPYSTLQFLTSKTNHPLNFLHSISFISCSVVHWMCTIYFIQEFITYTTCNFHGYHIISKNARMPIHFYFTGLIYLFKQA